MANWPDVPLRRLCSGVIFKQQQDRTQHGDHTLDIECKGEQNDDREPT